MIKISSVEFLGLLYRIIPGKIKNAVYHLGISALVLEIFKFEKFVKYANEITGDARWGGGEGDTLGISCWGCAAGTLEPLAYTRASSAEFCYPILE